MTKEERISNQRLIEYLEILTKTIGLRVPMATNLLNELRELLERKDYNFTIYLLKQYCKLEMKLFIKFEKEKSLFHMFQYGSYQEIIDYVTTGHDLNWMEFFNPSKELARVIAGNLPHYDSKEFENARVEIIMQNRLKLKSRETFISTIGHELAHVILYSVRHRLMRSEIATDLTAMIIGFSEIMKVGARGQVGYLDVDQFDLAYHWIRRRNGSTMQKWLSRLWLKRNYGIS